MTDWTHKLVKTENLSVETLLQMAHPENAREHPDHQLEATEELIETIGLIDEIKVNLNTNRVINGHARIKIALQSGQTSLPVNWYDLTEDEERLALEQYDATTYEATYNPDKLRALMEKTKGIKADRPALQAIMERLKAREGISGNGTEQGEPPEPQIDKATQLAAKWGTQTGQIWTLGEHRLAVGDCTDKAVVEAVMRGERAECLCTDPPYAFGLSSTSQMATKSGGWHDMMNNASWFTDRFRQWSTIIKSGPIWTFCNWRTLPILMRAGFDSKLGIYSVMVWYKDWIGPGGQQGLRPTYELITLTTLGDYAIPNRGIEDFISIPWSSHKPTGHRAEKPVDLIIHLLKISEASVTLDPFLGSGTTLIACEQLKRKCRAIEIDPGYSAVALQRWADLTGQEPALLSE